MFEPVVISRKHYSSNNEIDEEVQMFHGSTYHYICNTCLGMARFWGAEMFTSAPYDSRYDLFAQLEDWAKFIEKNNIVAFSLSRLKQRENKEYFIETCYLNKNYPGALILESGLPEGRLLPSNYMIEKRVSFGFVSNILYEILDALDIDYDW